MYRNQAGRSWISKAVVFSLSSSLAGIATGALLGAAGSLLSIQFRVASASLLAVVAIALGAFEFSGYHVRPLECNRETPQRWVHMGPLRWALQNGLALGCGATSRIGFWLWYAIPIGAFLTGAVEIGAAIYGTYGVVRGMAVWVIILGLSRHVTDDISLWLIGCAEAARTLAAGQLTILGIAVVIMIGL